MKSLILVLSLLVGTHAMADRGGDVGSMSASASSLSGKIVDLRPKPEVTKEQRMELAKSGQVFVARGGYSEDSLFGAPWPISSEVHHPISSECTSRFHASAPPDFIGVHHLYWI